MASRLSQQSKSELYDSGYRGLPWQSDEESQILDANAVNFDKILALNDYKSKIQDLDPQILYQSLLQQGVTDPASLEIIAHLSPEQVTRLLDYSAWDGDHLSPEAVLDWVRIFQHISPVLAYEQFRNLEEEYQLAVMEPFLKIYTQDELELDKSIQMDALVPVAGEQIWYSIEHPDADTREVIRKLVDTALEQNTAYGINLIAHAAYVPPNENAALIAQFRKARLEEDGFVTYEEAMRLFQPVPLERGFAEPNRSESALTSQFDGRNFFEATWRNFVEKLSTEEQNLKMRQFLHLGNTLSSAARITPDDFSGLRMILKQAQALVGVGLEYLAAADMTRAEKILKDAHPSRLFQTGWTLIHKIRLRTLAALEMGWPGSKSHRLSMLYRAQKYGLFLSDLDTQWLSILGYNQTEMLKGIFNRFPMIGELSADGQKIQFHPIANIRQLAAVSRKVETLAFMVRLIREAGHAIEDLERQLAAGVLHAWVLGHFEPSPVSEETLSQFLSLAEPDLNARKRLAEEQFINILKDVQGSALLREALADLQRGRDYALERQETLFLKDLVMFAQNPDPKFHVKGQSI